MKGRSTRRTPRTRALLSRAIFAALAAAFTGAAAAVVPGDLDFNFGTGGVYLLDAPGPGVGADDAFASLADTNGAVLIAGRLGMVQENSPDLVLLRVLDNGTLDPTFGNSDVGGIAFADGPGDADQGVSLARQADGKILVGGTLESGSNSDWGIARFTTTGALDTTFGEAGPGGRKGFARYNVSPTTAFNDSAQEVVVQSNGRVVLAGVSFVASGGFFYPRFALLGLETDGDMDATFATGGTFITPPAVAGSPSEYITDIATRADGSLPADNTITVVGYITPDSKAVIRRYTSAGLPDNSFDGDGTLLISYAPNGGNPTGLVRIDAGVLQPDGKLVVVGRGGDRGFAFMRFNTNGSLDTTFGNGGRINIKYSIASDYDEPNAIALQPNGKIVASGYFTTRTGTTPDSDFAVVRLTAAGQPDPTFGNGLGYVTYPLTSMDEEAAAVSVLSNGALLVSGWAQDDTVPTTGRDLAILRLFGDDGLFADSFDN